MNDSITVKDTSHCWCGEDVSTVYLAGVWQEENFIIGKCRSCGTLRTLDVSQRKFISENYIYEELAFRHSQSLKTIEDEIVRKQSDNTLSVLEVGCNTGAFLRLLKSRNRFNLLVGQDFNRQAIELNKDNEIELTDEPLSKISRTFRLIILMHVLEHVRDIRDLSSEIHRLTEKNGYLYICVPNINSYNFKRGGSEWGALNPVDHRWHFSKESLRRLAREIFPDWEIQYLSISWIWPSRFGIINWLAEGDQLELILHRK